MAYRFERLRVLLQHPGRLLSHHLVGGEGVTNRAHYDRLHRRQFRRLRSKSCIKGSGSILVSSLSAHASRIFIEKHHQPERRSRPLLRDCYLTSK